jgi:hypothetical protein
VVFEEAFADTPQLKLQDLTQNDIGIYIYGMFNDNPRVSLLNPDYSNKLRLLVQEIIAKASGICLWVRLVVKSLLAGIRNRDSISDLRRRLKILPADIKALYMYLLEQVEDVYRAQSYRMLQLVVQSNNPISTMQLSFAGETLKSVLAEPIRALTDQEEQMRQDELKVHLASRCAGMIEIGGEPVPSKGHTTFNSIIPVKPFAASSNTVPRVELLHQTVVDFVKQSDIAKFLIKWSKSSSFDLYETLLRVTLLEIKRYPSLEWSESSDIVGGCINVCKKQ